MSNEGKNFENGQRKSSAAIVGTIFGIFMIVIYIGMGVLFLFDFFGWYENGTLAWTRWVIGIGLIVYGIFRAYRQIAGIDYNPLNRE
ncbi:MAG: hypothetical protein K2M98_08340 [Muribaculum sp.]|nr:hypothetical protein [Muribaculum sp.]